MIFLTNLDAVFENTWYFCLDKVEQFIYLQNNHVLKQKKQK
jgi:hypothetical protein